MNSVTRNAFSSSGETGLSPQESNRNKLFQM